MNALADSGFELVREVVPRSDGQALTPSPVVLEHSRAPERMAEERTTG